VLTFEASGVLKRRYGSPLRPGAGSVQIAGCEPKTWVSSYPGKRAILLLECVTTPTFHGWRRS
jgi:hypothetical protein